MNTMKIRKRYKHQPEPITKSKEATIFWDFTIQTDRKMKSNGQDGVVKDYKRKTCFLIDMSRSTDDNLSV